MLTSTKAAITFLKLGTAEKTLLELSIKNERTDAVVQYLKKEVQKKMAHPDTLHTITRGEL